MFSPTTEVKKGFHLSLVLALCLLYALFHPIHAILTTLMVLCVMIILRK